MQRHKWFVMQEKCWSRHQTERSQRNYLARNESSQDSGVKGAHRFAENRRKAPRRSHIDSVEAWEVVAWDVTMLDTFAASHLPTTILNHGSAAESSAKMKTQKYVNIVQTDVFTPIVIETSGVLSIQARELLTELGKRIFEITGEVKETTYFFRKC